MRLRRGPDENNPFYHLFNIQRTSKKAVKYSVLNNSESLCYNILQQECEKVTEQICKKKSGDLGLKCSFTNINT